MQVLAVSALATAMALGTLLLMPRTAPQAQLFAPAAVTSASATVMPGVTSRGSNRVSGEARVHYAVSGRDAGSYTETVDTFAQYPLRSTSEKMILGAGLVSAVAGVLAMIFRKPQRAQPSQMAPINMSLEGAPVATRQREERFTTWTRWHHMAMCATTGKKQGEIDGAAPVVSIEANQEAINRAMEGANFHKKITLLGSTGSIGTQTLDIVQSRPENYSIVGLAAGSNVDLLVEQCQQFKPEIVAIRDESKFEELKQRLADAGVETTVVAGEQGIVEVAKYGDADTVVTGIVGCAGLLPTVAAIEAGKDIALANKETLISAGPVILPLLKKHGVKCLPADSEHSAIFQSLQGAPPEGLSKVILTASGGAFRDWDAADLKKVTVADALKHPNWSMGAKITIDSATLMNKGLEVIEAHYLFGKGYDDIEVVVHPQSIIHSMVEYADTSIIAQLGWPDMRLPLLYSMSWPHRIEMPYERLDFVKVGQLTFKAPDQKKYPCLALAYRAGRTAGTMPCALNAANEQAVELFRQEKIHYLDIPKVIEAVMDDHEKDLKAEPVLEDIIAVDKWAREHAKELHAAGRFENVYA